MNNITFLLKDIHRHDPNLTPQNLQMAVWSTVDQWCDYLVLEWCDLPWSVLCKAARSMECLPWLTRHWPLKGVARQAYLVGQSNRYVHMSSELNTGLPTPSPAKQYRK